MSAPETTGQRRKERMKMSDNLTIIYHSTDRTPPKSNNVGPRMGGRNGEGVEVSGNRQWNRRVELRAPCGEEGPGHHHHQEGGVRVEHQLRAGRDRHRLERRGHLRVPYRRHPPGGGGALPRRHGRPRGAGRSGAVSYTHLRAHETRHDLVCRLLLEKKK